MNEVLHLSLSLHLQGATPILLNTLFFSHEGRAAPYGSSSGSLSNWGWGVKTRASQCSIKNVYSPVQNLTQTAAESAVVLSPLRVGQIPNPESDSFDSCLNQINKQILLRIFLESAHP